MASQTRSKFLVAPGYYGLNREQSLSLLPPQWAVAAWNCVIDNSGRIASRQGWVNQTTSAITGTPTIQQIHEYIKSDGSTSVVAAAGNKLWESSDNGATWTDRTGALSVSANSWQFVNFNSKVIAAQTGHSLLVKTTGNFSAITASSGSVPTQPVAVLAAFGRVWAVSSDLQTIAYSALLDETKWAVADGGGVMDMRNVWTKGMDTVVALAAFAGRLIIFGRNHIVIYSDGRGSPLGLDPLNFYVEDIVEGTGTSARDSVQQIGEGDILFLGSIGVQSFKRVLQDKSNPIGDITKNSRSYVNALINQGAVDKTLIRSVYSPEQGFYLLTIPTYGVLCTDVRMQLQDGTYRLFDWPLHPAACAVRRRNGDLMLGMKSGVVGLYSGYTDNGASYTMTLITGYQDLGDENALNKELKKIRLIAASSGTYTISVNWWWDFGLDTSSAQLQYQGAQLAEYGISEYSLSEYGSGLVQHLDFVSAFGAGQFLAVGMSVAITGDAVNLHAIQLLYTDGRIN